MGEQKEDLLVPADCGDRQDNNRLSRGKSETAGLSLETRGVCRRNRAETFDSSLGKVCGVVCFPFHVYSALETSSGLLEKA